MKFNKLKPSEQYPILKRGSLNANASGKNCSVEFRTEFHNFVWIDSFGKKVLDIVT
jgi:hypothetical protein